MLILGIGVIALAVVAVIQHFQIEALWDAYDSVFTSVFKLNERLPRK